jgi:tetratricopeptide (TPR) repeat protein
MSRRNSRSPALPAVVVLVTIFQFTPALTCQKAPGDLIASGEQQPREGRTSYSFAALTSARAIFTICIQQKRTPEADLCYYDLARTDHYLSLAEQSAGDSRSARNWLNTALTEAQTAVAHDPSSAKAHALLGDIYGAKIDGMLSGIKYGPKANAETEQALRLDPHNAQAWSVLGRKYLYAPSLFGGDINRAIDAFNKATTYDPNSDEDLVWLAIALQKKGDLPRAHQVLSEALRLNGRSVFAQRELAALR